MAEIAQVKKVADQEIERARTAALAEAEAKIADARTELEMEAKIQAETAAAQADTARSQAKTAEAQARTAQALAKAISVPVIASGGVTDMDCIVKLNAVKDAGIEGVIIGRALYERTISLVEAQAYIDQN